MSLDPSVVSDGLLVPCGRCMACRIARRREWTMRCLHELSSHNDALFVTLTYSEVYNDGSLHKRELQKFFKRLRRACERSSVGSIRRIRYFACGEYGDKSGRPHYHCIIFGLSLSDEDKALIKAAWPYCDWDALGSRAFGLAEPDSIRYVAQYIDKKFTGPLAEEVYAAREPVFKVSSLGIGRDWCDTHRDQVVSRKCITVNGITHGLPRYYVKRLGMPSDYACEDIIESEYDVVESIIGKRITRDDLYRTGKPQDIVDVERRISESDDQRDRNNIARSNLRTRKI